MEIKTEEQVQILCFCCLQSVFIPTY